MRGLPLKGGDRVGVRHDPPLSIKRLDRRQPSAQGGCAFPAGPRQVHRRLANACNAGRGIRAKSGREWPRPASDQAGRLRRKRLCPGRSRPTDDSGSRSGVACAQAQSVSAACRRPRALCGAADCRMPAADTRARRRSCGSGLGRYRAPAGDRGLRRSNAHGQPARLRSLVRQCLHHQHGDRGRSALARRGAGAHPPAVQDQPPGDGSARMPRSAGLLGPSIERAHRLPLDPGRTGEAARTVAEFSACRKTRCASSPPMSAAASAARTA